MLRGREVIGGIGGKKEEEEKEGRLQGRKQQEQSGDLGSHLCPVCDTCQVSSLHLVSSTASEAQLCAHAIESDHSPRCSEASSWSTTPPCGSWHACSSLTSSPRLRQGSAGRSWLLPGRSLPPSSSDPTDLFSCHPSFSTCFTDQAAHLRAVPQTPEPSTLLSHWPV